MDQWINERPGNSNPLNRQSTSHRLVERFTVIHLVFIVANYMVKSGPLMDAESVLAPRGIPSSCRCGWLFGCPSLASVRPIGCPLRPAAAPLCRPYSDRLFGGRVLVLSSSRWQLHASWIALAPSIPADCLSITSLLTNGIIVS